VFFSRKAARWLAPVAALLAAVAAAASVPLRAIGLTALGLAAILAPAPAFGCGLPAPRAGSIISP
jgi:hypothetical protein